ncbi:hypothetical protein ACWGTI_25560 [Mesorhizobium sp. ArgA1]
MNSFSNSKSFNCPKRGKPDGAAFIAQQETVGSRSRFSVAGDIAATIEHTRKAWHPKKPPYGFVAIVTVQAKEPGSSASRRFISKALPLRHPRRAEGVLLPQTDGSLPDRRCSELRRKD